MARAVHWLLDIDGVVNADRPGRIPPDHAFFREEWADGVHNRVVGLSGSYRMYWSNELLGEIRKLCGDFPNLEIFLCSTWNLDPADLLLKLDFNWPLAFESTSTGKPWEIWDAKEASFLERLDQNIPVIWSDDEINSIWSASRKVPEAAALMLAPKFVSGLTRHHMELIRTFLEEQTNA